jgi:hypothetical protein
MHGNEKRDSSVFLYLTGRVKAVALFCDSVRTVKCIYGSVHREFILIRSNKMQQYAGIYLLQNHSTCFGCPSHPSPGVHKTVSAASGRVI